MDAKVCTDGSSVGRIGPDCEFAPCPNFSPKPVQSSDTNSVPVGTGETANPDSIGANWKISCKNIINDPKTKYKECGMKGDYNSADDKRMCEEIRGRYISCASPCRHDPPGTMCLEVCVRLCIFQ